MIKPKTKKTDPATWGKPAPKMDKSKHKKIRKQKKNSRRRNR